MIAQLAPYVATWRLLEPDSERALPVEQLQRAIPLSGTEVRVLPYGSDYEGCVRDLLSDSGAPSAYVTGSMYMLGRVRSMLSIPRRPLWERRIAASPVPQEGQEVGKGVAKP
jgi:folylpolyglutamate synthase/dihydropteroate synthase